MTTLLTGSHGFIGSHVRERLAGDVRCVDCFDPRVHGETSKDGTNAGATPLEHLEDANTVIHLAAQVGVADSQEDPVRYVLKNTMDTAHFLYRLRHLGDPKRIIVASSCSVYGRGGVGIQETDPPEPSSVYGLTKLDQEMLCRLLFPKRTVALRYFNVYGPGQALDNPYTGVLANFTRRILDGKPPIIFEDGQQMRDFVYVEDVAEATIAALDWPAGVYNICTGKTTTVEQAANALIEAYSSDVEPEITGERRDGDVRHIVGDPSFTRETAGWEAKTHFQDGIKKYAESVKRSLDGVSTA